jgi:hypothetical protein
VAIEGRPNVLVAEAAGDVVAVQDSREQADILAAGGVEPGGVAASDQLGLGELSQFLIGRLGIVHDRQSVEIAAVSSPSLLLWSWPANWQVGARPAQPLDYRLGRVTVQPRCLPSTN